MVNTWRGERLDMGQPGGDTALMAVIHLRPGMAAFIAIAGAETSARMGRDAGGEGQGEERDERGETEGHEGHLTLETRPSCAAAR